MRASVSWILNCVVLLGLCAQDSQQLAAQQSTVADRDARRTVLAAEGRPLEILNNEPPQAIVIGLPTAESLENGRLRVYPNAGLIPGESRLRMDVTGGTRRETLFDGQTDQFPLLSPQEYSTQSETVIPPDLDPGEPILEGAHEPVLGRIFQRRVQRRQPVRALFQKVFGCSSAPGGIGRERLPFAMFQIDSAQPQSAKGLQFGLDYGREFVDRAGIYWRRIGGGGPMLPEDSVNAQEARIMLEVGSEKFSTTTIIPFRAVDPEINPNHAGLSDMSVTTKTVLLDGSQLQMTQIFRSFFNTGASSSGLGTGNISFEPGMLMRYKFRPQTEFHGSLTYLFPVGADPIASGQAIRWGIGGAHTTIDTDSFALLSTLELTGWNVLNGTETLPNSLTTVSSDGVEIVNLTTGMRWVIDNGSDLGLFEAGWATTLPLTGDRWYEASLMFDLRWSQ